MLLVVPSSYDYTGEHQVVGTLPEGGDAWCRGLTGRAEGVSWVSRGNCARRLQIEWAVRQRPEDSHQLDVTLVSVVSMDFEDGSSGQLEVEEDYADLTVDGDVARTENVSWYLDNHSRRWVFSYRTPELASVTIDDHSFEIIPLDGPFELLAQ